MHKAQLIRKLGQESQPSSLRRKDSWNCNILGSPWVYYNKKEEKQHPAFSGTLAMDSAGYVVSRLHKINKRAAQRLAGAVPPQHCVGKGSCLCPCARARKSNPGSAMPEAISSDGRQCVFAQLNQLQWPCQLTWSTGKARSCLHGKRVHQVFICLQNEMQKYMQVFCLTLLSGTHSNMRRGTGEKKEKFIMGNEWKNSCPKAVSKWASS